jgi:hypothetical protein
VVVAGECDGGEIVPAWRRPTRGEPRWPMVAAVVVAVGFQVVLPNRFAPGHRLVPGLELALLISLVAANPHRTGRIPPNHALAGRADGMPHEPPRANRR